MRQSSPATLHKNQILVTRYFSSLRGLFLRRIIFDCHTEQEKIQSETDQSLWSLFQLLSKRNMKAQFYSKQLVLDYYWTFLPLAVDMCVAAVDLFILFKKQKEKFWI